MSVCVLWLGKGRAGGACTPRDLGLWCRPTAVCTVGRVYIDTYITSVWGVDPHVGVTSIVPWPFGRMSLAARPYHKPNGGSTHSLTHSITCAPKECFLGNEWGCQGGKGVSPMTCDNVVLCSHFAMSNACVRGSVSAQASLVLCGPASDELLSFFEFERCVGRYPSYLCVARLQCRACAFVPFVLACFGRRVLVCKILARSTGQHCCVRLGECA